MIEIESAGLAPLHRIAYPHLAYVDKGGCTKLAPKATRHGYHEGEMTKECQEMEENENKGSKRGKGQQMTVIKISKRSEVGRCG